MAQTYIETLVNAISRTLSIGLVPNLIGSPGVGKSSIAAAIAEEANLKLIDIRLSMLDPTDLTGMPNFTIMHDASGNPLLDANGQQIKRTQFIPNRRFPLAGMDEIPSRKVMIKGVEKLVPYDGWLILFDEIPSCTPSMQAAAYQIILDRMVGEYPLHDNVWMMAAGNRESDKAVAYPMSTALKSRMIHFPVDIPAKDWRDWACTKGFNHQITSYLAYKPEHLTKFDPSVVDLTFGCGRTWEFVNEILNDCGGVIDAEAEMMIKGAVGVGVGNEFIGYMTLYSQLPSIDDIIKDPANTPIPDELGSQYALSGMIALNMDKSNGSQLIQYANRMNPEFQVVMCSDAAKRKPSLMAIPNFSQWIQKNTPLLNATI